jgi:Ricin-type beta-trefoil lectin domain-like
MHLAIKERRWKRLSLLVFVITGLVVTALLSSVVPRARADVLAELRFAGNINSCLEIYGGPEATWDGAEAAIWSCWDGSNQKVRVQEAGDGYYYLIFAHSNKCLDASFDSSWGVRLVQWSCWGGDNQKWSGTFNNGHFEAHYNKHMLDAHGAYMCIDVQWNSPADGTPVWSWGLRRRTSSAVVRHA